MINQSII